MSRPMQWIKSYVNRHAHPDIQAAGFWGRVAFDELCNVTGEFGLGGAIPAKYAEPSFIARRTGATEEPDGITKIQRGIQRCIEVGLLTLGDGQTLEIPGWAGLQAESSSTERVRRHRAGKRNETASNVSPVPCNVEERRGEESREEDLSSNSAVAEPDPPPALVLVPESEEPGGYGPADLVADWNELAHPVMPRVTKLTESRRRQIQIRLRENPEREWWLGVIDAVNATPHCRGESRPQAGASKPWRCTLDFLVENDRNAIKALEFAWGRDDEPKAQERTTWL